MTVDSIRRYCLSFPHATENLQWGDDLCFKVRGKIFAALALSAVPQRLTFKCTSEKFLELIEIKDIVPAAYVGRYKWVMLHSLNLLPENELKALIRQSYEMIAAKADPQNRRRVKSKRRK